MWNEFKKYRFSDPNLFTDEDIVDSAHIDEERRRLFINTTENKSLAKVVADAKNVLLSNRSVIPSSILLSLLHCLVDALNLTILGNPSFLTSVSSV